MLARFRNAARGLTALTPSSLQSWKNLFEKSSAAVPAGPCTASQLGSAASTKAGTELVLAQAPMLEAPHCNYKVGGLLGKLKVCPSTATFQT